jgi:glycine reductase complex component B subunit gamma
VRVVHYLNQFFAGLGGEEAAGHEPVRIEGATGPGRGLAAVGIRVTTTLACGDDRFAEREDECLERLVSWLDEEPPDVLVCGPAFGSGRYGYACGVLAREASRAGIPVVSGMHPDNPGVLAAEGGAFIVPTSSNVAGMREALARVAALARTLGAGGDPGDPNEGGYLPRGLRRNEISSRTGADRAADMLLAKLEGRPFESEAVPAFDRVAPPRAVPDLSGAIVALVSEAGCVPQGNPDGLVSRRARAWLRYPIDGVTGLDAPGYETVHGGFDTAAGNADPNRLVPLDAVRELETEGVIGRLHEVFYTTTGVDTPVATAATFGQEIAQELRDAGVQAVVLTGT